MFQPEEHRRWDRDGADCGGPGDGSRVETTARAGATSPPPGRPGGPARLPRSARFDLVEWATIFEAPRWSVDPASRRAFEAVGGVVGRATDESLRARLYCRGGVVGALDAPSIRPRDDGWHVEIRRLFLVPAGPSPPRDWESLLFEEGELTVLVQPAREEVLEAVARACAYPAELLAGADPGRVLGLLEARRGRRVLATYGGFGGRGIGVTG